MPDLRVSLAGVELKNPIVEMCIRDSFCGAAPFLRNPAQWAAAVRLQKKLQQKDSQQMRGVV